MRFFIFHYIIISNRSDRWDLNAISRIYHWYNFICSPWFSLYWIWGSFLCEEKPNIRAICKSDIPASFSLAGLSWSVVLMNQSFRVNINLGIDFSNVLLITVPVILVYEVLDSFQRKVIIKSDKLYVNVIRYLLPVLTAILFFVCTIIFYFLCNDFQILSITI